MKKHIALFIISIICFTPCLSQEEELIKKEVDSLYREDQFYIGLTYNILTERNTGLNSKGFSGGLQVGFLRDFPLNKRRNFAIAIGGGYAFNKYGSNLQVSEIDNQTHFSIIAGDIDYDTNRFVMHEVEVPLEIRWRTSTPEEYKFWRIYGGIKLGYVFSHAATYKERDTYRVSNIAELNTLRYTAFLNFGWNTFNFQVQYALTPFFENAFLNDQPLDISTIKVGLMFYIL